VALNELLKEDLQVEERTNAGYDIIKTISLPEEEFVLGIKTINGNNIYVTWCCVNKTNYHYGHYIDDYRSALIDLYERAKNSIQWELDRLEEQK
jgi:hypothetical protein